MLAMLWHVFAPRHLKRARTLCAAVSHVLHERRDLMRAEEVEAVWRAIGKLKEAIGRRAAKSEIEALSAELEALAGRYIPQPKHPVWRENVEVLLVTILLFGALRAYFLQPFKIPTASMQPTLYGITAESLDGAFPGWAQRVGEFFFLGRNYIEVRSQKDDVVVGLKEKTFLNFLTFTTIEMERQRLTVFAPAAPLHQHFGVHPGRVYRAGEVIARGRIDTGDVLLVDKMSYHFRSPRLGEVFVFKTVGIPRIQETLPAGVDSQHYIKRLAGLPGQVLRIEPPDLLIDGEPARPEGLRRVMSRENGYRGYSNRMESGVAFPFLGNPQETFRVPPHSYFALGDNSYQSSDSRNWGVVPERSLTGPAFLVLWPLSGRWGLIN